MYTPTIAGDCCFGRGSLKADAELPNGAFRVFVSFANLGRVE